MREFGALSEEDRILIEDYVLGELNPQDADIVERRIQTDPVLRQELCALQATLRLLPQALPVAEPSPGLRDRILAADASLRRTPVVERQLDESVFLRLDDPSRPRQPRSLPWGRLAAGIAACLLLLLGLDNLRLRQALSDANQVDPETDTENVANILQQPNSRLVALQGEGAVSAAGTLLFTPGQWQRVVVSLGDLPPLAPEEIYRMWLSLENGQVIFCGEFNTDEEGNVFVELRPAEDVPQGVKATGIFVTVEESTAPIEPTGEQVMSGDL